MRNVTNNTPLPYFLYIAFLLLIAAAKPTLAESNYNKSKNENMRQAQVLIQHEMYLGAIRCLNNAAEEMPDNADVYNLLGFSHRKLKHYDQALVFYQKALKLNPKHKGANEYLGELYVETGNIDKAKQQLAILDKLCLFKCKEYKQLKKIIDAAKTHSNQPK